MAQALPARAVAPAVAIVAASGPEPGGFARTLLPRHRRRPLGFQGRLLLGAACRQPGLPVWSEVALHESEDGLLVAAWRHAPRNGAPPLCYADASRDPAALRALLLGHDPLADLPADLLLPPGTAAAAAGESAARLRAAWRALLAAALGLAAPDLPDRRPETAAADQPPPDDTAPPEPAAARTAARRGTGRPAAEGITAEIGPGMRVRLRQLGVATDRDLAAADASALRQALGEISRLLDVEAWIEQARIRTRAR
jgi:predicted flap endonuclease-1-like 5' DNA nuclease